MVPIRYDKNDPNAPLFELANYISRCSDKDFGTVEHETVGSIFEDFTESVNRIRIQQRTLKDGWKKISPERRRDLTWETLERTATDMSEHKARLMNASLQNGHLESLFRLYVSCFPGTEKLKDHIKACYDSVEKWSHYNHYRPKFMKTLTKSRSKVGKLERLESKTKTMNIYNGLCEAMGKHGMTLKKAKDQIDALAEYFSEAFRPGLVPLSIAAGEERQTRPGEGTHGGGSSDRNWGPDEEEGSELEEDGQPFREEYEPRSDDHTDSESGSEESSISSLTLVNSASGSNTS